MKEYLLNWIREGLLVPSLTQTIVVISAVCALGLLLARVHIGKISLGVTFVFFVGILASHFGLEVEPTMLIFCQNFGLVLFIYALGLQVGPSFFPSLKRGGVSANLFSLLLIALSLAMAVGIHLGMGLPISDVIGVLSGAVTNTPILAAAQSTIAGIDPASETIQSTMALACAVTYPLGVVGMLIGMIILGGIRRTQAPKGVNLKRTTFITEFAVRNPFAMGKTLAELASESHLTFIISRIWHNGEVMLPTSTTQLHEGDHVLVASSQEDIQALEMLLGERVEKDWNRADIDWDSVDEEMVSKRLIITRHELNGEKLENLKLRTVYGINVTRIDRSGIELLASPELHLQLGDRMTVVGKRSAIEAAEKVLGNEVNLLDAPNLFSLFIGLVLGCLLGVIPFFIPGMSFPIKLGLAGGPIVIGILMGAYGPRLRLTTYITNSASLLIRQLGIVLYLGCLGLGSGRNFFATLVHGDGLLWVGLGAAITIIPTLLVGWIAMRWGKRSYGQTCGILCGSMANPMVLDYLDDKVDDDSHNVNYATVYPLAMFVRIIAAQLLIILFI